jgi:hypothetical protein
MNLGISSLDLLYLALSVAGYAASATLWIYFAAPRQKFDRMPAVESGSSANADKNSA